MKKTTSEQESSHALDQYYWDDPYYIPVSYWSMMFGVIFNSCILMGVKGVNEPVPEDDVDVVFMIKMYKKCCFESCMSCCLFYGICFVFVWFLLYWLYINI